MFRKWMLGSRKVFLNYKISGMCQRLVFYITSDLWLLCIVKRTYFKIPLIHWKGVKKQNVNKVLRVIHLWDPIVDSRFCHTKVSRMSGLVFFATSLIFSFVDITKKAHEKSWNKSLMRINVVYCEVPRFKITSNNVTTKYKDVVNIGHWQENTFSFMNFDKNICYGRNMNRLRMTQFLFFIS